VAASDEQGRGQQAAQMAALVGQLVQLRYGRQDEMQADALGVDLMADARYDPRALVDVMAILARAGGGSRIPDFLSSHPDPGNRQQSIQLAIAKKFPGGVPSSLTVGRTISPSTQASAEQPR
jgi:predicted Zn-dependent protease